MYVFPNILAKNSPSGKCWMRRSRCLCTIRRGTGGKRLSRASAAGFSVIWLQTVTVRTVFRPNSYRVLPFDRFFGRIFSPPVSHTLDSPLVRGGRILYRSPHFAPLCRWGCGRFFGHRVFSPSVSALRPSHLPRQRGPDSLLLPILRSPLSMGLRPIFRSFGCRLLRCGRTSGQSLT